MPSELSVLFLCTGNSARSQIAEALLATRGKDRFRAGSAGVHPATRVSPFAVEILREYGIDWTGRVPKTIDEVIDQPWDFVITVCDRAKESCPIFPRPVRSIHLPFHDPHGEPLESFVRVRDEIRTRLVPAVIQTLGVEKRITSMGDGR